MGKSKATKGKQFKWEDNPEKEGIDIWKGFTYTQVLTDASSLENTSKSAQRRKAKKLKQQELIEDNSNSDISPVIQDTILTRPSYELWEVANCKKSYQNPSEDNPRNKWVLGKAQVPQMPVVKDGQRLEKMQMEVEKCDRVIKDLDAKNSKEMKKLRDYERIKQDADNIEQKLHQQEEDYCQNERFNILIINEIEGMLDKIPALKECTSREPLLLEQLEISRGNNLHFLEVTELHSLLKIKHTCIMRILEAIRLKAEKIKEESFCVVCLVEERDALCQPCNHFALCFTCADRLQECPICRQKIISKYLVKLS